MIAEQLALFRLPPESKADPKRHVHLGNQLVPYALRQGINRRLTLTIDERGLRVGAPKNATLTEIDAFIRSHADWVLQKLDEFAAVHGPRQLTIRSGTRIPLYSGEAVVDVMPGRNRVRWVGDVLVLEAQDSAPLEALARRGLQRRALKLFAERVSLYSAQMQITPPPLALTSARMRWGSCSHRGGIRLNWRLIHLPLHLIDYVVAHELSHLIEMNHSPAFWAEVEKLYPDWQAARDELKLLTPTIPIF